MNPQKKEQNNIGSKKKKRNNKIARSFIHVMSGSFLTREKSLKLLPFFFYLSFVAMCYIANGYYAEAKARQMNSLSNELKELRSEFITTKSDLMFISKQSEVAKSVAEMQIKESVEPPKKILIGSSK